MGFLHFQKENEKAAMARHNRRKEDRLWHLRRRCGKKCPLLGQNTRRKLLNIVRFAVLGSRSGGMSMARGYEKNVFDLNM